MVTLVSRPREIFTWGTPVPPTWMRQPRLPSFPYIVAMHWDGTYRDRLAGTDPGEYWSEFQYERFDGPASPSVLGAKHLA